MANYGTSDFKGGLKIMLDGDPHSIVSNEFVKPGKGQAFTRTKVRNLKTGRVVERTFRGSDNVESADVMDVQLQYLYSDGDQWHFMDPVTFEQMVADKTAMGDACLWLMDEALCEVTLFNGVPLAVTPPNFVEMVIKETDPGLRGDTATGGVKPAHMETGAVVKVPLFIEEGEIIKIDTRTGDYVSRVK